MKGEKIECEEKLIQRIVEGYLGNPVDYKNKRKTFNSLKWYYYSPLPAVKKKAKYIQETVLRDFDNVEVVALVGSSMRCQSNPRSSLIVRIYPKKITKENKMTNRREKVEEQAREKYRKSVRIRLAQIELNKAIELAREKCGIAVELAQMEYNKAVMLARKEKAEELAPKVKKSR